MWLCRNCARSNSSKSFVRLGAHTIDFGTQNECLPEDCCQPDFINKYATCLECLGIALGATNFTTAQQALNSTFTISWASVLWPMGVWMFLDLTMQCDDTEHNVPSLTLPGPVASGGLTSALATAISTQTTNAPADGSSFTIVPVQSSNAPADGSPFTIVPAQSSNTPTQSTIASSPAQSTNTTTSSAKQSCLIPHFLHVQVSVVLLGGLVHLALWKASFLSLPLVCEWQWHVLFDQMVPLCD